MGYSKYLYIAKIEILTSLTYYSNLISSAAFITLILFIFYNLWKAVYTVTAAVSISGFTLVTLLWYLVLSESSVSGSTARKMTLKIAEDVKSGDIAYYLNKPYNLIGYYFSSTFGNSVIKTVMIFAFAGTLVYFLVGPLSIGLLDIPFVIILLVFAIILRLSIDFLIAVTAFWVEDVSAFGWIVDKFIFIFGGMLIPLNFFPEILQKISLIAPFAYISYAPAYMFVNFNLTFFKSALIMQIIWIAVFIGAGSLLYYCGNKKVSINGG